MSIYKAPTAKPLPPVNDNLENVVSSTVSADTAYQSRQSMMPFVEGSPWRNLTYYSQYITKDMESTAISANRAAIDQQYLQILHFEIMVTSAPTPSQDPTTREWTYTGSGIVYAGVTAIEGDHIVADMLDGRIGLFTITRVERATITGNSAQRIEYKLHEVLDANRKRQLDDKVIKTVVFSRDNVLQGDSGILLETEWSLLSHKNQLVKTVLLQYIAQFYDEDAGLFYLPTEKRVVDISVQNALVPFLELVKYEAKTAYYGARRVSHRNRFYTVFEALNTQVNTLGALQHTKSVVARYAPLKRAPESGTLRYSKIDAVIVPKDIVDLNFSEFLPATFDIPVTPVTAEPPSFPMDVDLTKLPYTTPQVENAPWYHPIDITKSYVLSEWFYGTDAAVSPSRVDFLIKQVFTDSKKVDKRLLLELLQASVHWPLLERFYITPLLLGAACRQW